MDLGQHEGKVVPWSLTGLLVLNFICALAVGGIMHPRLTPSERLENSVTAFVLLDIGKMMAHEGAVRDGVRKVSRWLPYQTQDNLQELCALTAISTMGLPGNLAWSPSRSTEIALETFFGSLRSQFSSSQMRCRDYVHAGAKKMHQSMTKIKDGCEVHPHASSCPAPVTDEEFAVIAERALASAVQLMACSCEQLFMHSYAFSFISKVFFLTDFSEFSAMIPLFIMFYVPRIKKF